MTIAPVDSLPTLGKIRNCVIVARSPVVVVVIALPLTPKASATTRCVDESEDTKMMVVDMLMECIQIMLDRTLWMAAMLMESP